MNFNKITNNLKNSLRPTENRQGSFAVAMIAAACAIAVLFNLFVSQLPSALADIDVSGRDIYSVSDTSKELLGSLENDIQIIVLAEKSSVDNRIEKFIDKYAALSDRIAVEYIDPVQYPSALQEYGAEQNSVVVACADTDKQEVIAFTDIIQYDESSYYTTGQYAETAFDAEGRLTSAIDYVVNDTSKTAYTLQGHNETNLPSQITEQMSKAHFTVGSLNLLTNGSVPADCDLIIINAPTADLADDELDMLKDYLARGGHVTLLLSYEDTDTPNFDSLMQAYGIQKQNGYAADYSRYYQDNAYIFFPTLSAESNITADLGEDAQALVYNAKALTLTTPEKETVNITAFLTTSEDSAIITDNNEIRGQYCIAAAATEEIDENTTANLTVYGASSIIAEDIITSFGNLANSQIFLNSITADFADTANVAIPAKSLETTYNTIRYGGLWSILTVIVIPIAFLICGLVRWQKRRRL